MWSETRLWSWAKPEPLVNKGERGRCEQQLREDRTCVKARGWRGLAEPRGSLAELPDTAITTTSV